MSITADGPSVGDGLPCVHHGRNEAIEVNIPANLPTTPDLAGWTVSIAHALVQASAYRDSVEVAWLSAMTQHMIFNCLVTPAPSDSEAWTIHYGDKFGNEKLRSP